MTLVTRREAEPILGYAPGSLKAVMQQQRGRWPAPVACRIRGRALLWDLGELHAAARSGTGRGSRRPDGADPDGLVTCLECGRRFRSLGPHLARAHRITADAYREQHQLPASAALMATGTRNALSATRLEAIRESPDLLDRMTSATPSLEELARRSAEARAGTDHLPAVRAARRRGWDVSVRKSAQVREEHREQAARSAGYASWAEAISKTRHLSGRQAASLLSVGQATVQRWRARQATQ